MQNMGPPSCFCRSQHLPRAQCCDPHCCWCHQLICSWCQQLICLWPVCIEEGGVLWQSPLFPTHPGKASLISEQGKQMLGASTGLPLGKGGRGQAAAPGEITPGPWVCLRSRSRAPGAGQSRSCCSSKQRSRCICCLPLPQTLPPSCPSSIALQAGEL